MYQETGNKKTFLIPIPANRTRGKWSGAVNGPVMDADGGMAGSTDSHFGGCRNWLFWRTQSNDLQLPVQERLLLSTGFLSVGKRVQDSVTIVLTQHQSGAILDGLDPRTSNC